MPVTYLALRVTAAPAGSCWTFTYLSNTTVRYQYAGFFSWFGFHSLFPVSAYAAPSPSLPTLRGCFPCRAPPPTCGFAYHYHTRCLPHRWWRVRPAAYVVAYLCLRSRMDRDSAVTATHTYLTWFRLTSLHLPHALATFVDQTTQRRITACTYLVLTTPAGRHSAVEHRHFPHATSTSGAVPLLPGRTPLPTFTPRAYCRA